MLPEGDKEYKFEWEKLSVDERVSRADRRSHLMCKLQDMEPTMTN